MGVSGATARTRWPVLVVSFVIALLVLPAVGFAFPGTNTNESVRSNAPDDPEFDRCEPDNAGGPTCSNVFDQEIERFGFAPAATQTTATYNPPPLRRDRSRRTPSRAATRWDRSRASPPIAPGSTSAS